MVTELTGDFFVPDPELFFMTFSRLSGDASITSVITVPLLPAIFPVDAALFLAFTLPTARLRICRRVLPAAGHPHPLLALARAQFKPTSFFRSCAFIFS